MAQFTSFPASSVQGPTDIALQGQRLKGARATSQLQEFQLQQAPLMAQAAQEKRSQEKQLFDLQMTTGQRAQATEMVDQVASLLAPYADPNIPDMVKAQRWPDTLRQAEAAGLPVKDAPQTYDPAYVDRIMAQAGQWKTANERAGVLSPEAESQKIRITRAGKTPQLGTTQMQNAAAMGYRPGTPEYQQFVRDQALKPLVNIGGQETARSKAVGKELGEYEGKTYVGIQEAGRATREQDANLDRLDQLLDQTYTGKAAEFINDLRKWDVALGWNVIGGHEDIGPAEAAMALSNEMALQLRNPASGAGMPGALSDKDREFLVTMVPGLGQTRAGRKLLVKSRKRLNKRKRAIAKRARAYYAKNGTLGVGFENELSDWSDANPMFTAADMTAREAARLPHPSDKAARDALSSGTYYVAPDNEIHIKP